MHPQTPGRGGCADPTWLHSGGLQAPPLRQSFVSAVAPSLGRPAWGSYKETGEVGQTAGVREDAVSRLGAIRDAGPGKDARGCLSALGLQRRP